MSIALLTMLGLSLQPAILNAYGDEEIGTALQDGHVRHIDDQIIDYLQQLAGSVYGGVTVKQLLQMTSGVAWNETYTSPDSDRRAQLVAGIP